MTDGDYYIELVLDNGLYITDISYRGDVVYVEDSEGDNHQFNIDETVMFRIFTYQNVYTIEEFMLHYKDNKAYMSEADCEKDATFNMMMEVPFKKWVDEGADGHTFSQLSDRCFGVLLGRQKMRNFRQLYKFIEA